MRLAAEIVKPGPERVPNPQECDNRPRSMAILLHEVWRDSDGLPTCCLAGPDGDNARQLLGDSATLVWTFEAGSHFEAMTTYNAFLGREPYATPETGDHASYPDSWLQRQRTAR
jgi:hypothetical protein